MEVYLVVKVHNYNCTVGIHVQGKSCLHVYLSNSSGTCPTMEKFKELRW